MRTTRIKTLGLGKTNDADGNGKVEILVYPPAGPAAATDPAPAKKEAK